MSYSYECISFQHKQRQPNYESERKRKSSFADSSSCSYVCISILTVFILAAEMTYAYTFKWARDATMSFNHDLSLEYTSTSFWYNLTSRFGIENNLSIGHIQECKY